MRPSPDLPLHKLDVGVSKVHPDVVDLVEDLAAVWVEVVAAAKSTSPTFVMTLPHPLLALRWA